MGDLRNPRPRGYATVRTTIGMIGDIKMTEDVRVIKDLEFLSTTSYPDGSMAIRFKPGVGCKWEIHETPDPHKIALLALTS